MKTKEESISLEDAKKNYNWRVIPLSKLPEDSPVLGISHYVDKSMAEFHLCEEVIFPVDPIINHDQLAEKLVEAIKELFETKYRGYNCPDLSDIKQAIIKTLKGNA